MPSASTLVVFVVPAFLLLLVPGPAIAYIVARGAEHGRIPALVAVLGIQAADALHVAAAALGLTTLLVSAPTLFSVVKLSGAAYLLFLGIRSLVTHAPLPTRCTPVTGSLRRSFLQGVTVNLINPGTALFYVSFLPQFVDPDRGAVGTQLAVLGVVAMAIAAVIEVAYALLAGSSARRLCESARLARLQARLSGGIFLTLAALVALPVML